jgi:hypothetical protein
MKRFLILALVFSTGLFVRSAAQSTRLQAISMPANKPGKAKASNRQLYIDVHHLGAGKVTAKDVEAAHQKDLAIQKKFGVNLLNYWFDVSTGDVYCLASCENAGGLRRTHEAAHGLLPDKVYAVSGGKQEPLEGNNHLYLDVHELGAGKVKAKDVAAAHEKDLDVQKKYGVNLINYWVDEKAGVVMCLAQAPDSAALVNTHKEAHGLLPVRVKEVKQGQ